MKAAHRFVACGSIAAASFSSGVKTTHAHESGLMKSGFANNLNREQKLTVLIVEPNIDLVQAVTSSPVFSARMRPQRTGRYRTRGQLAHDIEANFKETTPWK